MFPQFGHARRYSPVTDSPFLLADCADGSSAVTALEGRGHQQLVHVVDMATVSNGEADSASVSTGGT